MESQFDNFCNNLNFSKRKKSLIKDILIRLYNKSLTENKDVWEDLREESHAKTDDSPRVEGTEIIKKLRRFLAEKQNERCCYCQRYMFNIAYSRPIEHILPRDTFPKFSLVMKNLAVACYDCNLRKTNSIWWDNIDQNSNYPDESQLQNAFHYNYHLYNEHISWLNYSTNNFSFSAYLALTPIGKKLYFDLLENISKTDILFSRNDEIRESIENIKQLNESISDNNKIKDFISELQQNLILSSLVE
ncbi:hypothetical protein JEP98_13465 [Providencia rettgeri]|uniref:HNH endonuclease n=1 Tax=Providencia TaxID=586 RepID=UPI0018E449AB|nr:hypothetical protein [Providencia rettgeri]MBI6190160.1 hypothetical protein [Providencia rettgeri]